MDKQFDASPEELDKIRRRREIRERLRNEFNRKIYNPYRMVYKVDIIDPGVQRFMAAKVYHSEHWKPSWRSFFKYFGAQILPTLLLYLYVSRERNDFEYKCETGQIPYADREHKCLNA